MILERNTTSTPKQKRQKLLSLSTILQKLKRLCPKKINYRMKKYLLLNQKHQKKRRRCNSNTSASSSTCDIISDIPSEIICYNNEDYNEDNTNSLMSLLFNPMKSTFLFSSLIDDKISNNDKNNIINCLSSKCYELVMLMIIMIILCPQINIM